MSSVIKSEYVILDEKQFSLDSKDNCEISNDVVKQSETIIKKAYVDSRDIIQQAKDDSIQIRRELYEEIGKEREEVFAKAVEEGKLEGIEQGILQGEKQGYEIVKEELNKKNEDLVSELCSQIYLVEESKEEILRDFKQNLIDLSITIAEKILKTKLDTDDTVIRNILFNTIDEYRNVEWIKIHISECDYAILSTDKELIDKLSSISHDVSFEVVSESEKGNLLIETPDKVLDCSTTTQLNNVKDILSN